MSNAKTLPELTPRQQAVYDFLLSHTRKHGYQPTIREIGTRLKINSPNGVMCHLKALARKGYIKGTTNKSRALHIPEIIERLNSV